MTSRNVAHRKHLVGWTAPPSAHANLARSAGATFHPLRIAAALLFVPVAACAAPALAGQATATQQPTAPVPEQAAPAASAPVPAPAAQEAQPLPRGATTTGRPATAPAPAATTPAQRPPQVVMPGPAAPATGSLLQTILALALVLGLLLGLAWFLKRYGPRAMGASANVKLVGALNIGGRERIMVVEVGKQWIVVGASPGRVNALATMPRQESAQPDGAQATLAAHMPDAPTPAAGSFGEWLKNTIDKRNAK